jgi:crotonobetainyl-CoA:carnitine CoA-transferase CaiB-like acyl-CoA transferase
MAARRDHVGVLVALLDEIFATKTLAEWSAAFDAAGMWWAPVQTTMEVLDDPQVHAAASFVDVPQSDGSSAPGVATPLDFSDTAWAPAGAAPECGQHTEEILLELGYEWEAIASLKERGATP